jgi:hypothetical protein
LRASSAGDTRSAATTAVASANSATSADAADQRATERPSVPAPQVVAVRPQATRTIVLGPLRSLLALLAILAASGLGLATARSARDRLRVLPTDGIALLPPRRGPPALV